VLNYDLKSNKTSIAVICYEINDRKGIFIIIRSQHKCCHQIQSFRFIRNILYSILIEFTKLIAIRDDICEQIKRKVEMTPTCD
jgi:hypothetical protein